MSQKGQYRPNARGRTARPYRTSKCGPFRDPAIKA